MLTWLDKSAEHVLHVHFIKKNIKGAWLSMYSSVSEFIKKVDKHSLCSYIVHVTSCLGIKIDISKYSLNYLV